MSDYKDLLRQARSGGISEQELSMVVSQLHSTDPAVDRYTLLQILGYAGYPSWRPQVEQFLACEEDPMLARAALQILCDMWGLTGMYITEILQFLQGVPWDEGGYVRLAAISIAGEYLRNHFQSQLLSDLIGIFEDETEAAVPRQEAYFALARAIGRDWQQLPSAARFMDLGRDADPTVLNDARERLMQE
jgi:hypothetical protein